MSDVIIRRIRVKKEESAYLYAILEAQEGIVSYSTLDHQPGDPFRDLELQVPIHFAAEVQRVIDSLGDLVFSIP